MPRTRTFGALQVVPAYARCVHQIDRMILACFVLGLSTCEVAATLLPVLAALGLRPRQPQGSSASTLCAAMSDLVLVVSIAARVGCPPRRRGGISEEVVS